MRRFAREPARQVLILGLGHIGASLAARLAREGWGVWGWDRDAKTVAYCRKQGWLYHVADATSLPSRMARVCVVALPERAVGDAAVLKILDRIAPGTIVTDVFSSKGEAVKRLAAECRRRGLIHCWSHPLAGREGQGASSADPAIFDGALTLIDSRGPSSARRELTAFWKASGCAVETLETSAHQRAMGRGSHLMHVVAYALAGVVSRGGRVSPSVLGATRVARSSPEAWAEILVSNRAAVSRASRALAAELMALTRLIEGRKTATLRSRLAKARAQRLRIEKGTMR